MLLTIQNYTCVLMTFSSHSDSEQHSSHLRRGGSLKSLTLTDIITSRILTSSPESPCITTFLRDCADMLQVRLRLMAADEPTAGCGATLRCLRHDGDWHTPPLHSPCLLHAYPFQPSGGAV